MRLIIHFFYFLLLLSFGAEATEKQAWHAISNKSTVSFLAIGKPAMLRIRGEGNGLLGSLEQSENGLNGTFSFKLENLKTGIDLRDNHMKEKYLEISKFPEAQLQIENFQVQGKPNLAQSNDVPFKGSLQLHGKKKEIMGLANLKKIEKKWIIDAKFEINISDFDVDIPQYMGIKVTDKIEVSVNLDLENK